MNALAPADAPISKFPPRTRLAAMAVILFGLAVLLQWANGAYRAEFGSEPDEAAHFVTGLCVRDYVAGGFRENLNPLTYAKKYYEHYPKVALGHWPPGFYALQTIATLPAGGSRAAVLLLMAALAAATAWLLVVALQAEYPGCPAMRAGLVFLLLPLTQKLSSAVMTEIPVALLALAATLCFARYLRTEKTRDAMWFGLLAMAGIMTKQSALALAGVPLLGVLLTGKFHLFKRPSFWLPALIVMLVCAPWTAVTLKLASEGSWSEEGFGWPFTRAALVFYPSKLVVTTGGLLLVLAAVGIFKTLRGSARCEARNYLFVALLALLVSVMAFQIVVPAVREARHLLPALPAVLGLAMVGWMSIANFWARSAVGVAAVALVFVPAHGVLQPKGYEGFGAVATAMVQAPDAAKAKLLVVSDARGEGMFIAEMALREARPGHVIRRGSKELAKSSWNGGKYEARVTDSGAFAGLLRTNGIGFVVFDASVPAKYRRGYFDLIERTADETDSSLQLVKNFPVQRAGQWQTNAIRLYRVGSR